MFYILHKRKLLLLFAGGADLRGRAQRGRAPGAEGAGAEDREEALRCR